MTEQSPYEKLGVSETASFDEIKEARDRLVEQYEGDVKLLETIESAYDAVLMDRLRMRQEGKIKVPDRIRFPEKLTPPQPSPPPVAQPQGPVWLQRFIDTPSRQDILLPAGLFLGLSAVAWFNPSLFLALGILVSLYFLNRKEHKLGRALLLTLVGSVLGVVVGLQLDGMLPDQIASLAMQPGTVAVWFTFLILWLITSFLR